MARRERGQRQAKKPASYKFDMLPQSVVTPLAITSFMCLADINEVTGNYGGSLLFTDDQLDNEVTFKEWQTKDKEVLGFLEGVDYMIDDALDEYNSNNKKPAVRADKFLVHTDQEGNETEYWEFKIKNKDQPKIVDSQKQRIPDFDELLGNGSKIKVQVNLVPYYMQGKVGVTAYVDYVLIKEVVEYGGGGGSNPFDDDDFDEDGTNDIPVEDEVEEEVPAKPVRKTRAKRTPPPAEEEEVADEPEAEEVPKPKATRKPRQPKKDVEDVSEPEPTKEAEAPAEKKPVRKRRTPAKKITEPKGEEGDF